jgi:O-methyltransferase
MDLISILKRNFWVQNFAGWICSFISPFVEHNLQKYQALRKSFYLTGIENLEGDYLEFGVFTGSSFVYACRYGLKMNGISKSLTRYFGYDSFQGFGEQQDHDKHPFYRDSIFTVNAEKVIANIKRKTKGTETFLFKGFYEDTLRNKTAVEHGINKARIVFIDCDLKEPADLIFKYVTPVLQAGSILMMDDFFSYKGHRELGISGAFNNFCRMNPQFSFERVFDYGYGGVVMICSNAKGTG